MDPRIKKLAEIMVNHSISVKKNDIILVNGGGEAKDLINEIGKLILLKGAFPKVNSQIPGFSYTYFKYATKNQLSAEPRLKIYEAENTHGVISIGTEYNTKELSSISPDKIVLRRKATKAVSDIILAKDNWVICEFPTNSLAQDADMSLEEFQDFVYKACIQDWKKQQKKQEQIQKILDNGNDVRIVGKDTDISFSIKGRKAVNSCGKHNLPDGEVFIAPVESSTSGYISYDFPVIYANKEISDIHLEFKKGKVVKATSSKNQDLLRKMIKIDPGASMLGEFGIGTNFRIKRFIKQILFDEKIGGTIHLALGMAYKKGGGKNESALHWDMIKDLRKGGIIYVDNKVLQKDGKFTFTF